MAKWHRSSLHSLLYTTALLICLATTDSAEDFSRRMLGTLGINYNLKRGEPYIQCQIWNDTADPHQEDCDISKDNARNYFSKKLACSGVFKVINPGKYLAMDARNRSGLVLNEDEYERSTGGCWLGDVTQHQQCERDDECVAIVKGESVLTAFCCCRTHNCNNRITVTFPTLNVTVDEGEDLSLLDNSTRLRDGPGSPLPLIYLSLIVAFSLLLFIISIILFRVAIIKTCLRIFIGGDQKVFDVQKNADEVPLMMMVDGVKRNNIKEGLTRIEVIGEGKLGIVQRGLYRELVMGEKERPVAVKSIKEQKIFLLEEAVYRLCANSHENVNHFIGSNFEPEISSHYLVMDYHENGDLEKYLQRETFTPMDALNFLSSLMDGLSFLHGTSTLPNGKFKHPIMHRDIKSRNVLVKADRTAAIADFGLAMICEGNKPHGRHYQVGTHRYMSPELLSGKANLNMDGLKMADVYAAALIIWEILNRTVTDEEDEVCPAELPYTKELEEVMAGAEAEFYERLDIGPNEVFQSKPIQYYLRDIVHCENKRPEIRERLKRNPITGELVKTTLDMWDFEVEGRISAACASARLRQLKKDAINGTIPIPIENFLCEPNDAMCNGTNGTIPNRSSFPTNDIITTSSGSTVPNVANGTIPMSNGTNGLISSLS